METSAPSAEFESELYGTTTYNYTDSPIDKPTEYTDPVAHGSRTHLTPPYNPCSLSNDHLHEICKAIKDTVTATAHISNNICRVLSKEEGQTTSLFTPSSVKPQSVIYGPSSEICDLPSDLLDDVSRLYIQGSSTIPKDRGTEIARTVVAKQGGALKTEKCYLGLSEEDYDGIETHHGSFAFEMRKDVHTIKPPSNDEKLTKLGNSALDHDIVDRVTSEKIIIRSPHLLQVIKEKIYWPSSAFYDGQKSLTLNSPYRSIGVYRDTLGEALKNMKADSLHMTFDAGISKSDLQSTIRHLELFLKEVDKIQKEPIELEKTRHERKMATFDMLWKLFSPGMRVYAERDGVKLACQVRLLIWSHGSISQASSEDPHQRVEVRLWYLDHDGRYLNRRVQSVSINRFNGEKSILELPVYPERFLPDWKSERTIRIERGRKFVHLIKKGYSYCDYKGEVSIDAENPYNRQNHQTYIGKVIVDPEQHFRESGSAKGSQWLDETDVEGNEIGATLRRFIKLDPTGPAQDNSSEAISSAFGDDQLFLLPGWIRGFTMATHGNRQWVWLHLDNIKEYVPDRNLMQTIALEKKDIRLLQAMTYVPKANDELWSPERIAHKGIGRVIILHGLPGLGKTYTVECLAAWSGRPVLRLTCAELGNDPSTMEVRFSLYLSRAERWKAIVLMDEADVYMTKRMHHGNSNETGIVSVFLRTLEYYSGIIFLTTNRITAMDEAIINRALLIVEYKSLSPAQIDKIIDNCLKQLNDTSGLGIDGEAKSVLGEALKKVDGYRWDGREIMQVLTVAARLASFENDNTTTPSTTAEIDKDHVDEAVRIVQGHRIYKDHEKKIR